MGSDIAGSIRTPAHFCGIFGHKPTYAIIPTRGHAMPGVLMDPDIGVVGPLARSAGDLELLLDVLVGADDYQPGVRYELPRLGRRTLGDLRVAVWSNDDVMPVETEIEDHVRQVADSLRDVGAEVNDKARPAIDVARSHEIYRELLWSFLSVAETDEAFEAMKQRVDSGTVNSDDYAARMESLVTIDHRRWLHLHNAREELRWAWHRFFQDYDVLLAPQSPTTALRHDHSDIMQRQLTVGDTNYPYYEQFFWAGLTGVAWLPSTVIPTGLAKDGLPIGIQIVGNAYHDRITIGVARQLEELGFRFASPPGYD
jgi:amidase